MSTTRSENSTPGIAIATEPVASTIAFASWVSPATSTLPSPASFPSPARKSILFFFQSICTPPARVSETDARRFWTAGQSIPTPLALMPSSAPCSDTVEKTSAVCSTVLAGMQA